MALQTTCHFVNNVRRLESLVTNGLLYPAQSKKFYYDKKV